MCSKIAADMEAFGLTNACLYKSLTVDTSGIDTSPPPHPAMLALVPPEIKSIFFAGGMSRGADALPTFTSEECKEFYEKNICGTDERRFDIFKNSRGQFANPNLVWIDERKNRVSASTARKIAFARSESKAVEYFGGSAFDGDNLRYGRETEPEAKAEYAADHDTIVHEPGLVICRHFPWLAASPDGIVVTPEGELIVLEVKCPVAGQSKIIKPGNLSFLKNNQLKKGDAYYSQVQIQLMACDAKMCHFYIYGKKNQILIPIPRDDDFI